MRLYLVLMHVVDRKGVSFLFVSCSGKFWLVCSESEQHFNEKQTGMKVAIRPFSVPSKFISQKIMSLAYAVMKT